MYQSFDESGASAPRGPRLAALRARFDALGIDAFLVPRADAHQGEYVAECDARLAWLTGFTGSAGMAVVTRAQAALFVDGRYGVQSRQQVDQADYEIRQIPRQSVADFLSEALKAGGVVGFDPWLHTPSEIERLTERLAAKSIALKRIANPLDEIWTDRPAPPCAPARIHPEALAGASGAAKRSRIARDITAKGARAAVLTLPDSIAWLLNLRGADLPRNPVMLAFAIIDDHARVQLFVDSAKIGADLAQNLGEDVVILPPTSFEAALADLPGPVLLDPVTAPEAVRAALADAGTEIIRAADPVLLPKACKTSAELAGMRAAHHRDALAMVRHLAWLDAQDPASLTEIDVVRHLEAERRAEGATDISFDTICGAGPNGAIVHYRVTTDSNRRLAAGELLLLDSGGQYTDGTTDITRTIPLGQVDPALRDPYTRVLRGMIALGMLRFPRGISGRDIDAVARAPLWLAGLDFDHGTGHGVGAALCVHEGPVRISRASELPLDEGMILSNEPGYYREGSFGIRLENLLAVQKADSPDGRDVLGFETLTWVPFDRRLIATEMMAGEEIAWLDHYHAELYARLAPDLDETCRIWLERACAPLDRA